MGVMDEKECKEERRKKKKEKRVGSGHRKRNKVKVRKTGR